MITKHDKRIESLIKSENTKLREIIIALNESGLQVVLVIDRNKKIVGIITDGDIRRKLLKGFTLNSSAKEIMTVLPMMIHKKIGQEAAIDLMKEKGLKHLPVVDKSGFFEGLYLYDDISKISTAIDNTLLIMAGGMGKRLKPYTENCPKPMLKISGKPILLHIIEKAIKEGFSKFTISLYYLPEVIIDYFGDGSEWNVEIKYIKEESPLGTAGGLSLMDSRQEQPFIVVNGDVMTNVNFRDMLSFHESNYSIATMAVREYIQHNPYGVVSTRDQEIIGFEEKPIISSFINAGVYVLEPVVLDYLEENSYCDMPALYNILRKNDLRTIVFPIHEAWSDIGRPQDLIEANTSN